MERLYTVYFIIKKNGHGYLMNYTLFAKNQKEAIKAVRNTVKETTGRTAFSATCKKPETTAFGMLFNEMCYTHWNEYTETLW